MKRTKTISVLLEEKICVNCEYFHPHYVKRDGNYYLIHIGHCSYPRLKDRLVTDICPYFKLKDQGGN